MIAMDTLLKMTMTEFRYAGKPIPSLQSLDSNERVIYMGTFSKSFYLLYEWDMLFYHHTF